MKWVNEFISAGSRVLLTLSFGMVVFIFGCATPAITDNKLRKELSEQYSGYYENNVWHRFKMTSDSERLIWRKKWEKRGYKFTGTKENMAVYTKVGILIGTIHNDEWVKLNGRSVVSN